MSKTKPAVEAAVLEMAQARDEVGLLYTHQAIGTELGISKDLVGVICRRHGLNRKASGDYPIGCKTRFMLKALSAQSGYAFNKTTTEIAADFGVTQSTARSAARYHGVKKRPRARQGYNFEGLNEKFYILSRRNQAPITLPTLKFMETKIDDECE